jgi:CRP/FNR family transcriptional regulator, anaerobic regulatory protein
MNTDIVSKDGHVRSSNDTGDKLQVYKDALQNKFLQIFGGIIFPREWPSNKVEAFLATIAFASISAGTTMLREGEACANVPFVLEGAIRVYKTAESGREITLYRIEKGQSCILSAGCGGNIDHFPATVIAEQYTEVAFLKKGTVRDLFSENQKFRDYVLDQYSRRMIDVIELVEEIAFRRVDERLAQWLIEQSALNSSNIIEATHQTLADHVGTSREVVSRILKDWEQRGCLEIARGSIKLLPGFERFRL